MTPAVARSCVVVAFPIASAATAVSIIVDSCAFVPVCVPRTDDSCFVVFLSAGAALSTVLFSSVSSAEPCLEASLEPLLLLPPLPLPLVPVSFGATTVAPDAGAPGRFELLQGPSARCETYRCSLPESPLDRASGSASLFDPLRPFWSLDPSLEPPCLPSSEVVSLLDTGRCERFVP